MELTFVDDIPERLHGQKGGTRFADVAAALKQRPGQWAILPIDEPANVPTVINNIRSGKYPQLREGFEAAYRSGVAYVRYVGQP